MPKRLTKAERLNGQYAIAQEKLRRLDERRNKATRAAAERFDEKHAPTYAALRATIDTLEKQLSALPPEGED